MSDNKELVQRFADEVFTKKNLDYMNQVCSSDYVCHDTIEGVLDLEANKQLISTMQSSFSNWKTELFECFGEGELVALRWKIDGTHEKDFLGVAATGKPCSFEGISLFRCEDGKIAEEWDQYDALGLLQQLGAIELEKPGGAGLVEQRGEQPQA
jgi:steroid delta-isomerase-like uncharacterized protein